MARHSQRRSQSRQLRHWATLGALALLLGCADGKPAPEVEIDPSLAAYELEQIPNDIPNPTFLDFGGKAHLVGYEIKPTGVVAPGQSFTIKMYWKSVSRLTPRWSLFTHIVDTKGRRLDQGIDDVGPLRARSGAEQAFSPSKWQPGKVYVDEQQLTMPGTAAPEVTVVVGIWKGNARLDVISGRADRERRGIVAHIKTGIRVARPKRRPKPAETK